MLRCVTRPCRRCGADGVCTAFPSPKSSLLCRGSYTPSAVRDMQYCICCRACDCCYELLVAAHLLGAHVLRRNAGGMRVASPRRHAGWAAWWHQGCSVASARAAACRAPQDAMSCAQRLHHGSPPCLLSVLRRPPVCSFKAPREEQMSVVLQLSLVLAGVLVGALGAQAVQHGSTYAAHGTCRCSWIVVGLATCTACTGSREQCLLLPCDTGGRWACEQQEWLPGI